MEIDSDTANNINLTEADIIAHILYEMTFCGYEEKEIQDKVDELEERVDELKNTGNEEIKKNSCTIEEPKKKISNIEENQMEEDNED